MKTKQIMFNPAKATQREGKEKKMGETKFTPGPWSVVLTDHPDNGDDCWGMDAADGSIGFCEGPNDEANARLCAAAPELFAVLEEQTAALENWRHLLTKYDSEPMKTICYNAGLFAAQNRALLAKARGESK